MNEINESQLLDYILNSKDSDELFEKIEQWLDKAKNSKNKSNKKPCMVVIGHAMGSPNFYNFGSYEDALEYKKEVDEKLSSDYLYFEIHEMSLIDNWGANE